MFNVYEYTIYVDAYVTIEGLVWADTYDEASIIVHDRYLDQDPELVYVNPKPFEPKMPTIAQTAVRIKD